MPTKNTTPLASTTSPAQETKQRTKLWHNVAVRLADEGVPVRAISRSLMLSTEEVREVLEGAGERGMILSIPRDDWPPGTRRDERSPDTIPLEFEDEHMTMLVMRTFAVTSSMAKIFVALLRRPEMTKPALHLTLQRDDADDPTEVKIVDVFICKLRKKLPTGIEIKTQWGRGYFIPHEGKVEAYRRLGVKPDHINTDTSAGAWDNATLPKVA